MTTEEFIGRCRKELVKITDNLSAEEPHLASPTDFLLVWYSKTLQNHKCIMFNPNTHLVYECTYNGDKREFYFDTYDKILNHVVPEVDKSKPRYKRIGQKIIDLGENRDRLYPYMVTPTDPLKGESNDITDLLDEFMIHIMSPTESAVLYTTREDFKRAFELYKDNPGIIISGLVVDYDRNECVVAAMMKNGQWELV